MNIEPGIRRYLRGEALSTGLDVALRKEKYRIISRENQIVDIIKNKRVIHIGCSDHIQVIEEKIKHNKWLHKLISENSSDCIGIDIDSESISFIQDKLGYRNVVHGDILSDDFNAVTEKKWDYVVFGEIIEHLDNPVDFLKMFKQRFGDFVSHFIITVPNIYNRDDYRNMLKYVENVNTDHRFSFTPYTICKVIVSSGYNPEEIFYTNLIRLRFMELVTRKLKYLFHLPVKYSFSYFNTIIVTGSI